MLKLSAISLSVLCLVTTSCSEQPPEAPPAKEPQAAAPTPAAPDLPEHEIFSRSLSEEEGTLHVRLAGPIETDELERLARYLREEYLTEYYRYLLINFYLPEGKKGERPWAAATFDPRLYIDMNPKVQVSSVEVLGRWRDDDPIMGGTITLYRSRRGLRVRIHFSRDGSTIERGVTEVDDKRGRRLDIIGGNGFGEYYLIDREGRLHLYDRDGLIRSAEPQ